MRRVQPIGIATCLFLTACSHALHPPSSLRGYEILVAGRDSLSVELARAFRGYGFQVRPAVKGGGPPAAAAVTFSYREPGANQPARLYARLADTRTGVVVAAAELALDSLDRDPARRARAIVAAMLTP